MKTLETDYLVIGAGTAGLAFADTLVEHSDARITLVDRRGLPGGHWNDAYPFVRLHQPSAFYGVNSMSLGSGVKDTVGLNAGLYELASGPEICGYFQRVLQQRLLPSGRVDFHPLTEVQPDGSLVSLVSGERTQVTVRRRVVDAAYGGPAIPATHTRRFAVAAGVDCVAPGALPGLWQQAAAAPMPRHFAVLGAGKTAMDTVNWLLSVGVSPEAITWVVPRDSWLINRVTTQSSPEFFHSAIGGQANQMQACAEAQSLDDLFARLEACGTLLRIHADRTPTMFHLATVSQAEAAELRRVQQVVRLGRVLALEPGAMVLEQGRVAVAPGTLFVDCTASAVEPRASVPIFQPGRIVLQMVRLPLPAFSAALIAYVEAHYPDDKRRNGLCGTVPFPYRMADYPRSQLANLWNQFQWGQDKELRQWIRASRLDGFGHLLAGIAPDDAERQAVIARLKQHAPAAMANLQRLVAQMAS